MILRLRSNLFLLLVFHSVAALHCLSVLCPFFLEHSSLVSVFPLLSCEVSVLCISCHDDNDGRWSALCLPHQNKFLHDSWTNSWLLEKQKGFFFGWFLHAAYSIELLISLASLSGSLADGLNSGSSNDKSYRFKFFLWPCFSSTRYFCFWPRFWSCLYVSLVCPIILHFLSDSGDCNVVSSD